MFSENTRGKQLYCSRSEVASHTFSPCSSPASLPKYAKDAFHAGYELFGTSRFPQVSSMLPCPVPPLQPLQPQDMHPLIDRVSVLFAKHRTSEDMPGGPCLLTKAPKVLSSGM